MDGALLKKTANSDPPACFVCMDAAADAVLIECGHGGLCAGAPSSLAPSCLKEEFPHNFHGGVYASGRSRMACEPAESGFASTGAWDVRWTHPCFDRRTTSSDDRPTCFDRRTTFHPGSRLKRAEDPAV